MTQLTFGLDPLPKKTGKEGFLDEMNRVAPWAELSPWSGRTLLHAQRGDDAVNVRVLGPNQLQIVHPVGRMMIPS